MWLTKQSHQIAKTNRETLDMAFGGKTDANFAGIQIRHNLQLILSAQK